MASADGIWRRARGGCEINAPVSYGGNENLPLSLHKEKKIASMGSAVGCDELGGGLVGIEGSKPRIEHTLPIVQNIIPPHLRFQKQVSELVNGEMVPGIGRERREEVVGGKSSKGPRNDLLRPGASPQSQPDHDLLVSFDDCREVSRLIASNALSGSSAQNILDEHLAPQCEPLVDLDEHDSVPTDVPILINFANSNRSNMELLTGLEFGLGPIVDCLSNLDLGASQFHTPGAEAVAELMNWDFSSGYDDFSEEKQNMELEACNRDPWWGPDDNVDWNDEYNWFEPDPFHTEFSLFSNLPTILRMKVWKVAVIENCMGRVMVVPETKTRDWHLVFRLPRIERKAKNATLPLPLTKTTKEARRAVFEASTCHLWVTDRLACPWRDPVGRVKKLHFRPNDILVIDDLEYIGARLCYQKRSMKKYGFSEGIKRIMFGKGCIEQFQYIPQNFIDAVHDFPDLDEVWISLTRRGGFYWHLQFFEPFIESSWLSEQEEKRILGTIDLDLLSQRDDGREPLKVDLISLHKYFDETRNEIKDWPVNLKI